MSAYTGPYAKNYAAGKAIHVGATELDDIESKVRNHPEDTIILGIYAGILDRYDPRKAEEVRAKIKQIRLSRG